MKAQKYPYSVIKVGATLYKVDAYCYDDGSSSVEIQSWVVRSIMKKRGTQSCFGRKYPYAHLHSEKYVHITQKIKNVTWGKRSRKNGDFGFLKSVSVRYKDKFVVGEALPTGVYTTILSALKFAVDDKKEEIVRVKGYIKEETDPIEIEEWEECLNDDEKQLKLLKARLNRVKKEKSK